MRHLQEGHWCGTQSMLVVYGTQWGSQWGPGSEGRGWWGQRTLEWSSREWIPEGLGSQQRLRVFLQMREEAMTEFGIRVFECDELAYIL